VVTKKAREEHPTRCTVCT